MILKTCPYCKSVNIIDESNDTFFCSRCGKKVKIKDTRSCDDWDFQSTSKNQSFISDSIYEAFKNIFDGNFSQAHETFDSILKEDEDNISALIGEAICAPYSRSSHFSRLKGLSNDISEEEKEIINKDNCKIFAKIYCEFDDAKRLDYMVNNYPDSITIDLLTKDCYKNKDINITSALIAGSVSTAEIFKKFMEFSYTSNNLYSCFDAKYLKPADLALLISAGLSTTDKIIDFKKYKTIDSFTQTEDEKISLKDFFSKYFTGTYSESDGSAISDYYRFYGYSYYDNSAIRQNITVTSNSYLNIIDNYKIKTQYKNVQEYHCHMATYIFGSYDCPELWVLRRFRDKKLYTDKAIFPYIDFYYALSPKLINRFNKSDTFKNFVKSFLTRLIQILKSRGYEDTPYTDFI